MKRPWRLSTIDLANPIHVYLLVNLIFGLVLALIFIYAIAFSPEEGRHPIPCVYTALTGEPCASCGLSRGLSSMIRGQFQEAASINPFSPRIFLFFALQLLLRLLTSLLAIKTPIFLHRLVVADASITCLSFALAFLPMLLS